MRYLQLFAVNISKLCCMYLSKGFLASYSTLVISPRVHIMWKGLVLRFDESKKNTQTFIFSKVWV